MKLINVGFYGVIAVGFVALCFAGSEMQFGRTEPQSRYQPPSKPSSQITQASLERYFGDMDTEKKLHLIEKYLEETIRKQVFYSDSRYDPSRCGPIKAQVYQILLSAQKLQEKYLGYYECGNVVDKISSSPILQFSASISFLSSRLSQFTKATRIFTTRDYTHTNVAAEFHQACDNIPNTLVIIKSGQYIAGGYTEVPWSSHITPNTGKAFLFSVNMKMIAEVKERGTRIQYVSSSGPNFGQEAIKIPGDYSRLQKSVRHSYDNDYNIPSGQTVTLFFGDHDFKIDEYEVYKLE